MKKLQIGIMFLLIFITPVSFAQTLKNTKKFKPYSSVGIGFRTPDRYSEIHTVKLSDKNTTTPFDLYLVIFKIQISGCVKCLDTLYYIQRNVPYRIINYTFTSNKTKKFFSVEDYYNGTNWEYRGAQINSTLNDLNYYNK